MLEEAVYSPDKENSPFIQIKGTASIYKESKLVDKINLEEVEPISNMTFGQLIHDAFNADKGVILGRM